jgi:predicted MPP superfamily phosphohydrolase
VTLFLITFLSIYGGMHIYAFYRLKNAFHPAPVTARWIGALMFLMTFMPLVIRMAEWSGLEDIATVLAWPGYIWMGALFLFTSALTCTDLIRLITWLVIRRSGSEMPECLGARLTCEVVLILSLCATIYSFFEARDIRTEHLTVSSRKLPASAARIRVVQLSDIHLGLLVREDRLKRILTQVTAARPDVLVSTGDLVDGRLNRQGTLDIQGRLPRMLAAVRAPLGTFAVTGNHEFYAGIDQALAFTSKAGFRILRNETQQVGTFLSITGVDDPAVNGRDAKGNYSPETALLRSADAGRFRLLLKHRPLVSRSSDGLFDLQLSGHAHNGQLFPFTLLVYLKYHITGGTATTAAGSLLHVSRGSGTWGPPLRFLAPPEVTVIDIVPSK